MALLDSTVFVLPKHDAVIAITAGTKDMQRILNLIWDQLEPVFVNDTIAANPADSKRLQDRLVSLSLPLVPSNTSLDASKYEKVTYRFDPNDQKIDSVAITRNAAGNFVLSLKSGDTVQSIECGTKEWIKQRSALAIFLNCRLQHAVIGLPRISSPQRSAYTKHPSASALPYTSAKTKQPSMWNQMLGLAQQNARN